MRLKEQFDYDYEGKEQGHRKGVWVDKELFGELAAIVENMAKEFEEAEKHGLEISKEKRLGYTRLKDELQKMMEE